jgi:alkaline phosphatase D
VGTLQSLNGGVLKLSAQFMPIGETEPRSATLQYRVPGGSWRDGPTAAIEPGFTAHFRVATWDSTRDWEYRVAYRVDTARPDYYAGTIRRDPVNATELKIALFSCAIAAVRSLEGGVGQPELPQAELLGRYTHKSIYVPHRELVENAGRHQPDLLVFAGDQLYENSPTRRDNSLTPTLDYLYKWYLWIWSFRELTRSTPTIVLVDDHDVYHGNVWGNGGRAAPDGDQNKGGYRCTPEWVNIVQRTQCGHNPDPDDPTPVDQGISVYYGAFQYGGVSFALLEDRKFKTAPIQGTDLDVHEGELLGERQETFLETWAGDARDGRPKICLTQTLFACLQTSPAGRALLDFDSNGYPKLQRDRAIGLLRRAGALVLAGDQHLASVVRHGVDTFTDGVVQFTGPAMGTSWQRWFEPARPLPNARGAPATGDFVDAFGNKVRVLAVANPKVTFKEYRVTRKGRAQGLGDRRLKSEGYGIVRVDRKAREYTLECWPWNVDPLAQDARQFPGWPFHLRFDETDGRTIK